MSVVVEGPHDSSGGSEETISAKEIGAMLSDVLMKMFYGSKKRWWDCKSWHGYSYLILSDLPAPVRSRASAYSLKHFNELHSTSKS